MGKFQIIRIACLAAALLMSFVPFGIAANFLAEGAGTVFTFPALTVAVGVITIILIPTMLAIDTLRRGAPTSFVIVELAWVGLLTILWLAVGAHASASVVILGSCDTVGLTSLESSVCHQFQALQAFSWLIWLTLGGYLVLLATLGAIQQSRGNRQIWQTSVADYDFFAPQSQIPPVAHGATPMAQYPQQQQQFAPQQQYAPQPGYVQPQYTGPTSNAGHMSPQPTGHITPQPSGYTGAAQV